jgi:glycosyltransferase involved in cell wall biosynthesis
MRVTFINRFAWPDHSATAQLLSDLAAALSANGDTVTLVSSRLRYDDPGMVLPKQESWRGVDVRRVWTSSFGRSSLLGRAVDYATFYLSLPFTLFGLLRKRDVVVVMTDPPLLSMVVAPIARLRGGLRVNWLQDLFPEVAVALGSPRIPGPFARLLAWLRDRSLHGAAANVAIGERMAERLRARGIPNVQVIPNWPHEDAIRPLPAAESRLRQRLGLLDRFVVGYSGNLGRAHDWEAILNLALALSSDPRIVFLVGGGGYGYDALRERVASESLQNVIFQPYHPMEYLSDSMAAADLHLVSLRPEMEGLIVPSKFYGIAAAQRAVGFIGDPDGELGRLVREHLIGFAIPADEPGRIAAEVRRLAGDAEAVRRLGASARQLLEKRFSRDATHRRWHDLMDSLEAKAGNQG